MRISRLANMGMVLASAGMLLSISSYAAQKTCTVASSTALQKCIDTGAVAINSVRNDTLVVKVTKASMAYRTKITVRAKKNVIIVGDTVGLESARPTLSYKDVDPAWYTSTTYDYSGAVLIDSSRNVTLAGLIIDGLTRTAMEVTYPSGFTGWKGNNALSIRRSYGVRAVRCSFKNAWRGVLIRGENLGGASAYPNPQDDIEQVRRNLPTSNSGQYGRHLIERCRLYDNSWGIVGDRDWDIGSIFRYNEFYDNYVREADKANDPWNQAGGALFTDDVAITPYRIHNNSFLNNGVIFGGYYKVGTQHLFYNNLVGRPKRYHKDGFTAGIKGCEGCYTQTERQTEMLKFFSEHQRSNVVEPQDNAFTSGNVDQVTSGWNNFRMFRIKMDRGWENASHTTTKSRSSTKDYDPNYPNVDTLALTWYVEEGVSANTAASTGGKVMRIRQNMWTESYRDPSDNNDPKGYGYGFIPKQIKAFVSPAATNRVFRDVSKFDLWWTPSIPFTSAASTTRDEGFLKPSASTFTTARIAAKGWPTYSSVGGVTSDLGALSASGTGYADNALPQLELADTLVEVVRNDTVEFPLNVFSWNGLDPAKLSNLQVVNGLSKFYRTMPVTDTIQNQSNRRDNGTYGPGACASVGGADGVGTCRTQVRSVLDSMPWPDSTTLTALPWVNDSLKAGGLRATRYQYVGIFGGGALPASTNYARAEVVMSATYNGKTIYSNPAVFIYSKPKYHMIVNVLQADCKSELPLASDGMSKRVMAGERVCLQVKPDIDTNITLNFKPLFADFTSLMGSDTAQMRLYRLLKNGTDSVFDPVKPGFDYDFMAETETLDKNATKDMGTQFRQAGVPGRITMRALFNEVAGTKISDLRYIQGVSPRILVVPNTIYQATIDTVIYESDTTAPDPLKKGEIAARPITDSTNVTSIPRHGASKATVVIHLRDAFGNILADSVAAAKARGLKVRVSTPTSMYLFDSTSTSGKLDSLFEIGDGARITFQGLYPFGTTPQSAYLPLVSAVVNTNGPQAGETFANDTSWVFVAPTGKELVWTDSSGKTMASLAAGVGHAVPVRISALQKGAAIGDFAETVTFTAPAHVRLFATLADTTPITSVKLAAGVSPVFYLRAVDSLRPVDTLTVTTAANGFEAPGMLLAKFTYPNVVRAIYTGECGKPQMLRITFDSALYFRGNGLQPDQFTALFPGQVLLSSVKATASKEALSADGKTLDIVWDAATATAGTGNSLSLFNPLIGRLVPRTMIQAKDSVVPVLLSTAVFQGYVKDSTGKSVAHDSVVAYFSNAVDVRSYAAGNAFPFDILRDGQMVKAKAKLSEAGALVDSAKHGYSFEFLGQDLQIVPNDTLMLPGTKDRNYVTDLWGNTATNGCSTPPTTITGRFYPKDALIFDRDGDGNGDSLVIWFQSPLGAYPERILVRWGVAPAETLTVTSAMLQNWGVRVTDASGPGDSILRLPLPSPYGVSKGSYTTATWTHYRTAGPADTAYFNDGLIKVRIRDSIGPVARNALLHFDMNGTGMDTLVVDLSEAAGGTKAGDSASFDFQLKHGELPFTFPEGSVLVSVKNGVITLVVPNTAANAIQRGDSLRVTPGSKGGLVQDVSASKNYAGDLNPWIVVKAGIRPPLKGWYLDTNGDGRVETALLKYTQNPRGNCPQFVFYWPDTTDNRKTALTSTCQLDSTSKDSLRWKVSFPPFDYGVTGSVVKYKTPLGVQLGNADDPTTYRFFMGDSVGPVLLDSSWLRDNANTATNPDTLRIVPSEQVIQALIDPTHKARLIVQFKRGKTIVADSSVKVLSLIGCKDVSDCRIVIGTGSTYRPVPGDWVRLSVADSVFDSTSSLNKPSVNHPFVPIHGLPRPPYVSAYYDRDHDGRIDSVAMIFTVPPEEGTIIEVGDPAGDPTKVRTYKVGKLEDGFVGFTIEPWGENVTSVAPGTIARVINPVGDASKFALADSAAPVVSSAGIIKTSDRTGKTPDTLVIKASEPVKFDSLLVFTYRPKGSDSSVTVTFKTGEVTYDSATGTWRIPVLPLDENMPEVGDSIRLAPGKSITDLAGNVTGPESKSTVVVELRPRILAPLIGVNQPIFTPGGTGAPFVVGPVKANPLPGRTEFTFSSNMPAVVHLYIYDNAGVYLNDYQVRITKDYIASAKPNRLGEASIGISWNGTSKEGSLAVNGVYMVRFVVQRDLTNYEVQTGTVQSSVENYIVKVGVKR